MVHCCTILQCLSGHFSFLIFRLISVNKIRWLMFRTKSKCCFNIDISSIITGVLIITFLPRKNLNIFCANNLYAYLTIIWEFSGICNSEMGWLQFAPLGKSLMFSSFAMVQRCNTTIILQKNASEILEWVFLALMTAATTVVWIQLIIFFIYPNISMPNSHLSVALLKTWRLTDVILLYGIFQEIVLIILIING